MRFHQPRTQFYCGVDLHSRNMYLCVVNRQAEIVLHRNLRCQGDLFLKAIEPFRPDLTVACECMYAWYWLADLCADQGIEFALGHALYMRAIHQGKTKNDRIDSEKIARLTQSGTLPLAYTYPPQLRGLRDLLRRRIRFVRTRAQLYTHIQHLRTQANLSGPFISPKTKTKRQAIPTSFSNEDVMLSAQVNLEMIEAYDRVIERLESHLLQRARGCRPKEMRVLQTIPGVGAITALTILLEIDSIQRFATRQQFASYCRLVKCPRESAGKQHGNGGRKMGNPYLKWAFSEAAIHAAQWSEPINGLLRRLESRHGKGKGKSLLAHRLGRAVYHLLRHGTVFDEDRFLHRHVQQRVNVQQGANSMTP